ncbi:MAG: carbohydrate binding domain-containing protein, partial [Armatimonadetes bacterium]|nr:carbohydrate binding domain-containing protein [Armatimonadota bacterium]
QIGQTMKQGGEVGKTYTFSALIKPVAEPATLHLEIERAGRPWDRALKAPDVEVPPGQWTEIHATFKLDQAFAEGWQAYLASGQDGALFRADLLRLYEGDYVPWQPGQDGAQLPNLLSNASFEGGTEGWWSYFGEQYNLRRTFRRSACLLNRVLGNMGVQGATPLLERFAKPAATDEQRWLQGLYLDQPITWDDPYRFFCW